MADRFDEILEEMRSDRVASNARLEEMRSDRLASDARFEALREESNETRRFLSEMNRRAEVVFQEVVLEMRDMREDIRASTETTKAHTRAIFAVIDRLEGNGGAATAS